MPQFDAQSAERISQTVQEWERRTRVQGQAPPGYSNPQWWRWMVLTEVLAAGGEADANPVSWAAAGTYDGTANKGAYTVLTGTTYTVRDTTGKLSGSIGDWVLCRPIGNDLNVTVWEVVGPGGGGKRYKGAVYTATVAKTAATFEVSSTHPVDGGADISGDEPITVQNWANWEASSGMPVLFEWDAGGNSGEGEWIFVQGPCKADWSGGS